MTLAATIADVQDIAKRSALREGKKILGITASVPAYIQIPDDTGVFEFVCDVQVIDGPTANVIAGNVAGSVVLRNVLVAHEAVGEILAEINVPVEMERSRSGQLQITNRAKIAIPALNLNEYTLTDLLLTHLADIDENGLDPFGIPISGLALSQMSGPTIGCVVTTNIAQSIASQLNLDPQGAVINLGVNAFQRSIITTSRACTIEATEVLGLEETGEVT